jgi:polyisoprenoid-binding protein YceI
MAEETPDRAGIATERLFVITPANTSIRFRVRNLGLWHVEGTFAEFHGTARVDLDHPTAAAIDVSIAAASIQTGIGLRDRHLQSRQFLHADRYPSIRFQSARSVPAEGSGRYLIPGELTIRGRTRPTELRVRGDQADGRVHVEIDAVVHSGEFGVPGMPLVVGRTVEVAIEGTLR